jgi:hypothetical protein
MGTKNNPGEYDCYEHAEPDEPMFVLLGRDATASVIVHAWASLRERLGNTSAEKLAEARACASAMADWATRLGKDVATRILPVRKEIEWFAVEMEQTLRDNDHKGHWSHCGYQYLTRRLHEEVLELNMALVETGRFGDVHWTAHAEDRRRLIREATDVANFAMMIADNVRAEEKY